MTTAAALRRVVSTAVVVAVGVLLTLTGAGPAAAHAVLVGTDPEDGAVLDEAPDSLVITFNEPVQPVDGATALLDADGAPVDATVTALDTTVVVEPGETLGDGTYVVSWRVISLDTHPVAGAFSFSVGTPSEQSVAAEVRSASPALAALQVADQAAISLGLFVLVGTVLFELLVLRATPGGMPHLRARLARVRRSALVVAVPALALSIPLTPAWQAGGTPAALLDLGMWRTGAGSDVALAAALGIGGSVAAVALTPRAGRASRSTWPAGVAVGAGVLALCSLTVVGHTRTFGPAWLVVSADMLHVLTGAAWLGGIIGLTLTLAPAGRVSDRRAAATVSRFSTLGAWLVLVLALTGMILGWRILGSVDALVTTGYGRTLLVKLGLALCLVLIAAWNRYRLVPDVATRPDSRRLLRRTVGGEATLLVTVLAVTGLLVSQSPTPTSPALADGTAGQEVPAQGLAAEQPLGDGLLTARVTPGTVGVNSLELALLDADGEPIDPVADPELEITLDEPAIGPFARPLTRTGPGTYEAPLDVPMPGSWTMTVSVRTSKYENPIVTVPLEVTAP
ncbi:copper resistance protein CopC [Oerskovia flava]|uniref:copper resistance protein CopC n=1 Tax=Oerskovia flava TaxID=2986422 RepID=UPI00223F3A46|nr:copper resistance protein CopC [Oerskovia sp. JB1-3-2]